MSAASFSNIKLNNVVKAKLVTFDWVHASTYTSGGEKLTPQMLGLNEIHYFGIESWGGVIGHYDYTNQKIMFYWPNTAGAVMVEVSSVDLSSYTFRCIVVGR